jgi:serine phosphatase RsbU (regulator of sigma subunit)
LRDIIRRQADAPAKTIRDAVVDTLQEFRGNAPQEDDVTLVVVKLL